MGTRQIAILALLIASMWSVYSRAQTRTNLFQLQWALRNTGETQRVAIDHYTSGRIIGVPGEDIRVPETAAANTNKVIVAVLDTGVDYTHPQLKEILAGKGYNFVNNNDDASDTHGHGTHVSGIIGAKLDASGFRGVTQNALILPVKVVQTGPNAPVRPQEVDPGAGTALTENVAKGLKYAIQNGAKVINLSLAWPSAIRSKAVDDAMKLAADKDVIVVSSAGNDSTLANVYPCIYANVVCVGAQGPDGAYTYFSNYGSMVDILAPGISILSTWPMNKNPSTFAGQIGYEFRNGTSMAAPVVAGMLVELLSRGMSPSEAKARLFLGARATQVQSRFETDLQDTYSNDANKVRKTSRYGNADLANALEIKAQPLVVPAEKAPLDLVWDGVQPTITATVNWKNLWVDAHEVDVTVGTQVFHFAQIKADETVSTTISIPVNSQTQSAFTLPASAEGHEFEFSVQIRRILSASQVPANATKASIERLRYTDYDSVRSVVAADGNAYLDLLLIKGSAEPAVKKMRVELVQNGRASGSTELTGVTSDQLLNPYRLPDSTYAFIFSQVDEKNKPFFLIKYLDGNMKPLHDLKIATDVTVLSEDLKWVKSAQGYNPIWISYGYTPKPDLPKYTPWDPNFKDSRLFRIYLVREGEIRSVKLSKNQLPLQILEDGSVLIADGYSYFVKYTKAHIADGEIKSEDPVTLKEYRNLIGLTGPMPVIALDGASNDLLAIPGPSTPGTLRISTLGSTPMDDILNRASPLEVLIMMNGAFLEPSGPSYFVQTHYDLKYFKSGSNQTISTSLNRYSYIPSMIFNRNFYPLITQDQNGKRYPSVYIAASIANADVSEVLIADSDQQKFLRPALFRIQARDCVALGNFIAADGTHPAQLVFVCGTEIVKLPLTIQK
ncbi:MAG: S8 family serine peptidase [Bdellovibrionales bacterium]|nr:S8 family serine peptidase [Bdellovibrionales bacterium]